MLGRHGRESEEDRDQTGEDDCGTPHGDESPIGERTGGPPNADPRPGRFTWRFLERQNEEEGQQDDAPDHREEEPQVRRRYTDLPHHRIQSQRQKTGDAEESETFLAYVPDRALSRREEGMAGVVVSDQRIVYRSNLRHKEADNGLPITLQLAMTRELGQINIETPQWKVLRMTIDREGVRRLRRALTIGRFSTTWD